MLHTLLLEAGLEAAAIYGTLEPARAWLYQANQTTVSTSMVNPFAPTGTRNWYAEVTVGKLRPCEDVLLCIDIDGAGGTLDVDTGIRVATSCASVEDVAIYPGPHAQSQAARCRLDQR